MLGMMIQYIGIQNCGSVCMFLPMFLICAVATLLLLLLSIKLKKVRGLFLVLTLLGLLPTAVTGLIAFGQGALINYPGAPEEAVSGMIDALREQNFEAADKYVLGDLGLEADVMDESDFLFLGQLLCDSYAVSINAEPIYEEFTATLPVELTRLNTESWMTALAAETELALHEIVQSNTRDEVFNDERTAYLEGIAEKAYWQGVDSAYEKAEEHIAAVPVDVTLSWTPFGWKVVMDEALIGALEGFEVGDEEEIQFSGNISQRLRARLHTERAEIMDSLPLIEKVFTIPQDALAAPEPDPKGFGSTDDPNEVLKVIEQAKDLIGDRTLSWSPEIEIKPGSKINYYYDESILVIQWKEFRNWSLATFAEVIVKDGSQIRRVMAGDEYLSWDWETPTQMSQRTNAVLGMTGDFYMFRAVGIVTYQGQVYRSDPKSLHHLFFTNSGEMLLTKSYELAEEDVESYVAENDVNFSLAFGPVIIENGEKLPMPNYLVGEFYDDYPRAAIGEVDPLHFIVMTVGKEGPRENQTVTLPEAQQYIWEKGVHKAYALDGGKTANMTFNGELTNDPTYRQERTMSDMFYFASAIPEEER